MSDPIIPTPENPIPDVDDIKPGIPSPAWPDEGGGGGTGGGVLNLHMDRQTRALDKTWAEIDAAFGSTVIFMDATALLIGTEENAAGYFIYFADFYDAPTVAKITFKADTENDYPVAQMG